LAVLQTVQFPTQRCGVTTDQTIISLCDRQRAQGSSAIN